MLLLDLGSDLEVNYVSNWIKLILGLFFIVNIAAFIMEPYEAIVILLITSVLLYASEVIPPVFTSFLILFLLYLNVPLEIQSMVLSGFQSQLLFFLIAVFGMGMAVANSGIGRSFVYHLGKMTRKSKLPVPFLLVMTLIPLSLFLPSSITRNAMLHPLLNQFVEEYGLEHENKRIGLTLGVLNPMVSSALLTGGLSSILTASLLGGFTWWSWFLMMVIPYYSIIFIGLGYILIRYPIKSGNICKEIQEGTAPTFSKNDWTVVLILLIVVALWVSDSFHSFPPVVPAILGLVLLFIFTKNLGWEDMKKSSAFENVIIIGSLLSLIEVANEYGIFTYFSNLFVHLFSGDWPFIMIILLIIIFTAVFNLFIPSIVVCLTILIPFFIEVAPNIGLNPVAIALLITITVDSIKFYPTQSTPILMVYDKRIFSIRDISQMGVALFFILIIVTFVVILPYWKLLGLDVSLLYSDHKSYCIYDCSANVDFLKKLLTLTTNLGIILIIA